MSTLTVQNDAAGLTNGTVPTPGSGGNTGGSSGHELDTITIGTGTTLISDNTHVIDSSMAYKIATGSTSASVATGWGSGTLTDAATTYWMEGYFFFTGYPPSSIRLMKGIAAGGQTAAIDLNSSGAIVIRGTGTTTIATVSGTIPLNQWVRIEYKTVSSATVGQVEVKVFGVVTDVESSTPDITYTSAATQNTTGGVVTNAQYGSLVSVANVPAFWMTQIGYSSVGYIGAQGTPGGGGIGGVTVTNSGNGSHTAGDVITTGNSGTSPDTAFTAVTGSPTWQPGDEAHAGSPSMLFAQTSAVAMHCDWGSTVIDSSPLTGYFLVYIKINTLGASALRIVEFLSAAGQVGAIDIGTTGKVLLRDAAGNLQKTSTTTIPNGKWCRLEGKLISSASSGYVECQIFVANLDEITPDETAFTVNTLNTGGGVINQMQYGSKLAVASSSVSLAEVGFSDAGYMGPTEAQVATNTLTVGLLMSPGGTQAGGGGTFGGGGGGGDGGGSGPGVDVYYNPAGTTLTFEDRFAGPALDTTVWGYQNGHASNNNAYDQTANVTIAPGGGLVITPKDQAAGGQSYTSGSLTSGGKKSFTQGFYAEVRAIVPIQQGIWPAAIWFRPDDGGNGEFDPIEQYGFEPTLYHQTIVEEYSPETKQGYHPSYPSGFDPTIPHIWGMWWKDQNTVYMYLDGVITSTWTTASTSWLPTLWRGMTWNMRINVQVGGSYGGLPDGTTQWDDAAMTVYRVSIFH